MSELTPDIRNNDSSQDNVSLFRSLAQEYIAEPYPSGSLRPLRRQVKLALRELKRAGHKYGTRNPGRGEEWDGFCEWLNDNYHLLVREGNNLLTALKYADQQPSIDKWPATCLLLKKLVRKIGVPGADEFDKLIETVQRVRPLTVFELEQLPLCIRAVLILTAAEACGRPGSEAERLISIAVTGLRRTVELNFAGLTERHSIVERILKNDPAGVYPRMDEKSRADYRRRTAMLALKTGKSEAATAAALIEQAEKGEGWRQRHVGAALGAHIDNRRKRRRGIVFLVSSVFLPAAAAVALAALVNIPALTLAFYLPLIELFRPLLQQALLKGVAPVRLPRIELGGVIPEEGRTVITVSALLPGAKNASRTAERLFRLYNTNGQGAVQVCMLADLKQADYPTLARDTADIAAMRREIVRLNRKYGDHFVLAVRPRKFSPTMNAYTGYERKRGAITELVRVIKGGAPHFVAFEGSLEKLRRAKYLLALDSDTGMLLDTAAELVGTALHPLVRPQIDSGKNRVVKGYGILIPRIGTDLLSANKTPFSRATAGVGGITPYDTAASDLYMDCFSSAIFTGKGLIDVEAFSILEKLDFPKEQVLSHDILEGCILRTGLVSDIEMTDSTPSAITGWISRLHRWIRGDWQNMPFLFNKKLPLGRLDKWKLTDNLRRSLTPAACLLCLLISPFFGWRAGQILALTGLLSPISGSLLTAALSLIHGGWLTLGGRYYSRVLPRALSAITQAWFTLIMLPATALNSLDAAVRAVFRLITRRRMLDWATAAQADKRGGGWGVYLKRFWPTIAAAAYLIYFGMGFARLAGIVFAMLLPFAVYSGKSSDKAEKALTANQREQIHAYAAAAWRYYEEQCTAENNYLPPDNVQETPVWRVAHKTSPTNIGLYLMCIAAAHDFGLIDDEGMLARVENTLGTIEKLEKWNGNLLNWYDTRTLRPLAPRYVSTVDSGNFACCLVSLCQALHEIKGARAEAAAERARRIQREIDLRPLYNRNRSLFHIGLDPDTGERSGSFYDLLMSESRMTGYYAIARRIVQKKHWGALGRTLTRAGNAIGLVSWTGTMFEYFMPRLWLPAEEGTMEYEALRFCLYCQRRRPPHGVPWGMSESGFYAFDSSLNYQYKAHGVPRLALKRGLGAELVISPYSSFLALTTAPDIALKNLNRLERLGMTGSWGFYEAVDFTKSRAARGGYSIVRSYMAHHVGMSMIACANAVMDDIFVRRFLRDRDMERAIELCYEKAPAAGAVYEPVRENNVPERPGRARKVIEEIRHINPKTPRMHLLAGAEWQLAITDTGAGISSSRGLDIHRFSEDLLRDPQGIFAVVDAGGGAFSITAAPDYATGAPDNTAGRRKCEKKSGFLSTEKDAGQIEREVEFENGAAIFTARRGHIEAGMRAMVHPRLSCEQRQVVVKNNANHRITATVMFYFEPSLARRADTLAHPAFSRIFLTARRDEAVQALFVARRQREGEPPACLAVGLLDGRDFEYELSREKLLDRPLGITALTSAAGKPFSSGGEGVPDCAVAVRVKMDLPPHVQKTATLVLTAAPSIPEAANRLIEVRREGLLSGSTAAPSPFGGVEAELAAQILPDLFYPPRMMREWAAAARRNTRGQEALWPLGISGDFPIILVEIHNAADASRAEPYMRLHRSLLLGGVPTELAIVYHEGGEYNAPVLDALREAARNADCTELLGKRAGIHPINLVTHGEYALPLLTAVCAHNGARDLRRPGVPPSDYSAAKVLPAKPVRPEYNQSGSEPAAVISGGVFKGDRFIITESPRLPWCHIIANEEFGTMVSDMALGFTWAVNSRENRLTPWTNDTASDNRGEMLLLKAKNVIYDTVFGAAAEFGSGYARYTGKCGDLVTAVTVSVPKTGSFKKVELTIQNTGGETVDIEVAYYTEPVLGVNRGNARHTIADWVNGALIFKNPFSTVKGSGFLTALGGADGCDCDRGVFLAGDWGSGTLSPLPDPCAAVIVRKKLPPRRQEKITFVLGFAADTGQADTVKTVFRMINSAGDAPPMSAEFPKIRTPDPLLNAMASHWLPWQTLICRIHARTGFYQCGGAWGFRDQLQDSISALWFDPQITRRQILRCAAAQFEEGDVMHWWYQMPGIFRGVRTRCSDDLVWLPFATAEYVEFTGDVSILDEQIGWLSAEPLRPDETDRYFSPQSTAYTDSLYQHCIRALQRACTRGEHGLPLIGSGDWNDGFSQIGVKGKGESVWLAMFLSITLDRFAAVSAMRGEEARAEEFRKAAEGYRAAADSCFTGDRYIRAFFDDGTPLGVPGSAECEIDSIAQSFAVLAGLPEERAQTALDTALRHLVDRKNGVVKLMAPPFARSSAKRHDGRRNPVGYISAYPPGLRENGGQYTHAAAWLAIALFKANRPAEGLEILKLISPAHKYAGGLGEKYKGEPYALAGDVYAHPECPGRAGWTHYTGSSGWYYTAVLRYLLGLEPRGRQMYIRPCLPPDWESAGISININGTPLEINIARGEPSLKVDGKESPHVPLDGAPHQVELTVRPA
ncbi:MAG TPA: glucoamylase family protein [Candidatus Avimonas sp.]|nr:glucoamylase family protein [Candidatus Avimonas sp.]